MARLTFGELGLVAESAGVVPWSTIDAARKVIGARLPNTAQLFVRVVPDGLPGDASASSPQCTVRVDDVLFEVADAASAGREALDIAAAALLPLRARVIDEDDGPVVVRTEP
jgi:ribosomal protein L16/L10AE